MPDFSSHLPRFLRTHLSSRSQSSPAKSRNDSYSSQPPPSSHPSSRLEDALEQDRHIDTDHLDVSTTWGDSAGQPSLPSPPIASILTPKSISPDLVARTATSVSPVSDLMDSTQVFSPSDSLATSLQQSLVVERRRPPSSKDLTSSSSQHQGQEVFENAHNFSVVGSNFIETTNANITNNINVSNQCK